MDLSTNLHALAIRRAVDVADRSARARAEYQRASAKRAAEESKRAAQAEIRRVCLIDVIA